LIFEKIIMMRAIAGISAMRDLESYRWHLKIMKAIQNRNVREARKQIRKHVQVGREAALEQIAQRKKLMSLRVQGG